MTDTVALSQLPTGQAIAPALGNLTLDGTKIGSVTPQTGSFTTVSASTPIGAQSGGTGNAFTLFTGPATSTKTFTLPNATSAILTSNAAVTVAQGGTGVQTLLNHGVLIGNGTGNVGAVAPGTSGNLLTSDGTNWTSAAAGASGAGYPNNGYLTGRYYDGLCSNTSASTASISVNVLYSMPFIVAQSHAFDRIGTNVSSTGTATVIRMGIYNVANGIPTSLVLDAGTVSVSGTGNVNITITQTLAAGIYALALVADGTVVLKGDSGSSPFLKHVQGVSDQSVVGGRCWTGTLTFGALPGTFPTVSYDGSNFPTMMLRSA